MGDIVVLQARVDFTSELSIETVGGTIAAICFGGGQFVGEHEGIWDEVPARRLDREVLGLEVILGGTPGAGGGYTLEVMSKSPLGGQLPVDPVACAAMVCDFSVYLTALLRRVPSLQVQVPGR